MSRLRTSFHLAILLFLLGNAIVHAQGLLLEQVMVWPENADFLGSPAGYAYLAQFKKVEVFSSQLLPVFSSQLKGNQKIFASQNGAYWGQATFDDHSSTSLRVTEFSLHEPSGHRIYTLKNPNALRFVISDRPAPLVGVHGTEGLPETDLRFYDAAGKAIADFRMTNYMGARFSRDGRYLFASSLDSGLYVFDSDGKVCRRLRVGKIYGSSDDGEWVLTQYGSLIELHNLEKRIGSIAALETGPRKIIISADKKTGLLIYDRAAICYSLPDLQLRWSFRPENDTERISSGDLSARGDLFAFGIALDNGPDFPFTERFTKGRIVVLDSAGTLTAEGLVTYATWSSGFPEVKFTSDGRQLWVVTNEGLYRGQLKF